MGELRNRYVNCQTPDGSPVPWEPPELPQGAKADGVYFGRVLVEMDRRLDRGGLTVYITQDLERLPSYGRDVVVLLIGDEMARIPSYVGDVRAIFKNFAVRPELTANVFREPSWVNLWALAWFLRAFLHHRRGLARYRRLRRSGWAAPIFRLPIGVLDQVPLPVQPVSARRTDVFFAGSVGHEGGAKERVSPKVIARRQMVEEAERLATRHPELSIELVTTEAFAESMAADAETYSRGLMDARIALVPRGAATETFRFWQALRAGCVVVADSIPCGRLFFTGAPVVRIGSWTRLEPTVLRLLGDVPRLEELHRRSLHWWDTRAAEETLGAYMADRLNTMAA